LLSCPSFLLSNSVKVFVIEVNFCAIIVVVRSLILVHSIHGNKDMFEILKKLNFNTCLSCEICNSNCVMFGVAIPSALSIQVPGSTRIVIE